MHNLQRNLSTTWIEPLHLPLQKTLEPRLPDSRQHHRRGVGRTLFLHREYDLVSQIATESLQLFPHVGELRAVAALLLFPPVAQRRTLLHAILKQLAGFAQRG